MSSDLEVPKCPDRLTRDHRDCDVCDDYVVATRGTVAAAVAVGPQRAIAALHRLAVRSAGVGGE